MTSEVEGLAAAVERFEAFLRVNRLVGEGLVRNGQILSWRDFDALLAALRAQAERVRVLEGELEWQPIKSAPRDGKAILVGHPQAVFSCWWDDGANGWVDGETNTFGEYLTYEPTHWRHLPPPPALLPATQAEREK